MPPSSKYEKKICVFQEKGGIFSGIFKKPPKSAVAAQSEEVTLQRGSVNPTLLDACLYSVLFSVNRTSNVFMHFWCKVKKRQVISGFVIEAFVTFF